MSEIGATREWLQELDERQARARTIAGEAGCDVLLVFGADRHGQTFRYLTNFEPVLGDMWLLLGEPPQCFLTFQWQIEEARRLSGIERWAGRFDPLPLVVDALRETGARRVGLAGFARMPVPAYRALESGLPGVELVALDDEVDRLRRRKSPVEVAALRQAAALTDRMLDAARSAVRVGVTEHELVALLTQLVLSAGGENAFEPTVVAGVDEAIPIRRPTDRAVREGDTVMVDLGAAWQGYQADATRTFVLGRPSHRQLEAWDVVRRAYEASLDLARPGVPCLELHRVASEIIESAGFELWHRVGHGIGLATSFEWPSLDSETAPLEPGVTICIEPGVYAVGVGNMKLEDDVLITEHGCELLTKSDHSLEVPL
jgi:Xaa-Pro aminopeptidase